MFIFQLYLFLQQQRLCSQFIDSKMFFAIAGNFLYAVNLVAISCDFSPHQENVTSSEGAISFYHQKLTPNWTIHLTFLVEKLPNILRCITKIEIFLSLLNYFGIILMQNTFFPRFFF